MKAGSHGNQFFLMHLIVLSYPFLVHGRSTFKPLLFMDKHDVSNIQGLILPKANPVEPLPEFSCPPVNYTAGATIFGAFPLLEKSGYEFYVVIGRAGKPVPSENNSKNSSLVGISVLRFTTDDFVSYSHPIRVLFLPDGPLHDVHRDQLHLRDGLRWTVKSIARNDDTGMYLLFAAYQTWAYSFVSNDPSKADSFNATHPGKTGNFDDHDDTNVIYSHSTKTWVDIQIIFQNRTSSLTNNAEGITFCDNAGCTKRRVVSVRTSQDGTEWSNCYGCISPSPNISCWKPGQDPAIDQCCIAYNHSNLIEPDPLLDPPELQFYRFRPFYLGNSDRLAAHMTLYAPSPYIINDQHINYGYLPRKCRTTHLKPDVSIACHGPHMHDEWVLGAKSGDPSNMSAWRRPFRHMRVAPHDIWLMAPPVHTHSQHVWVGNGAVWGLPLYRLAGLYAPANAIITTPIFTISSLENLWLNVQALWYGDDHQAGYDEGRAAYVMVELINPITNKILLGYEKEKCVLMNVDGLKIPLVWQNHLKPQKNQKNNTEKKKSNAHTIQARIYFRDATIYALGSD